MSEELARDLGSIETRLDNHEKRLDKIDEKLDTLVEYAARTKGGWFALAAAGGLGGAIVAGVLKFLGMVKGGG